MTDADREKLQAYVDAHKERFLDPEHAIKQLEFVYEWALREGWRKDVEDFLSRMQEPFPVTRKRRR
jgi:hypothetical protein